MGRLLAAGGQQATATDGRGTEAHQGEEVPAVGRRAREGLSHGALPSIIEFRCGVLSLAG
jgi:hypothetical protein